MNARLQLGKLHVDVMSFAEALGAIERLVDAGRGGSVFTPNVDHVVQVETNAALESAYARASLCFADGAPLVWASRALRPSLPERVAGADLVLPLLELAARRGWRVALLGAAPGVAERAATVARHRFGTEVALVTAPLVDVDDGAQLTRIAAELNAARPHLALMALGAPKQELLIDRLQARICPTVSLGIGAGLDFVAGTMRRAPALVRRVGLEWAFRLAQEPRRMWRRYLVQDPAFIVILARALLRAR